MVFPDPVGPVTKKRPCGFLNKSEKLANHENFGCLDINIEGEYVQ